MICPGGPVRLAPQAGGRERAVERSGLAATPDVLAQGVGRRYREVEVVARPVAEARREHRPAAEYEARIRALVRTEMRRDDVPAASPQTSRGLGEIQRLQWWVATSRRATGLRASSSRAIRADSSG